MSVVKMKFSDKLKSTNSTYSVNKYDNGFMVEVSGSGEDGEWKTVRILAANVDDLVELIKDLAMIKVD